jgi:hypothetical protein
MHANGLDTPHSPPWSSCAPHRPNLKSHSIAPTSRGDIVFVPMYHVSNSQMVCWLQLALLHLLHVIGQHVCRTCILCVPFQHDEPQGHPTLPGRSSGCCTHACCCKKRSNTSRASGKLRRPTANRKWPPLTDPSCAYTVAGSSSTPQPCTTRSQKASTPSPFFSLRSTSSYVHTRVSHPLHTHSLVNRILHYPSTPHQSRILEAKRHCCRK